MSPKFKVVEPPQESTSSLLEDDESEHQAPGPAAFSADWFKVRLKSPFALAVIWPFLIFAFYQLVWASPRYESQTQLIVQQPNGMSTLEPSVALLAGFTGTATGSDAELVKAFVSSADLLNYLRNELQVSEHYSDSSRDMFGRLSSDASNEDLLEHYLNRIDVEINDKSSVMTIKAQAYTPEFAQAMAETIVGRAEWYINKIGNDLAKAQLDFVKNEHDIVKQRLDSAKQQLLSFQRKHNLLDPEAEGMALQQIAYGLEGQIAAKKAELGALRASMSETAPQVLMVKQQLASLETQLNEERQRLTNVIVDTDSEGGSVAVNEVLARYAEYKVDLEFAVQAYSASQVSMEKSRIEAYRQLKYLVVVESPTLPQEAKYPTTGYNLTLFLVVACMIFAIGRIIFATAKELK